MASAWAEQQLQLLELEKAAEAAQLKEKLERLTAAQCQEAGLSLLQLQVESSCTSLYGRVTFTLTKRDGVPLPVHQMKVGDEVEVIDSSQNIKSKKSKGHGNNDSSKNSDTSLDYHASGVISKVSSTELEFVCDDSQGNEGSTSWMLSSTSLRLNLRCSEATHKKLVLALESIRTLAEPNKKGEPRGVCSVESTALLLDAIFGDNTSSGAAPYTGDEVPEFNERKPDVIPFNARLNSSQLDAISHSLHGSSKISLIHGPPGTGKTTAVTELILQAIIRGKKVLVCAPSNVAVDNLLERLAGERFTYRQSDYALSSLGSSSGIGTVKVHAVRIGHPARMSSTVQKYCLDSLVLHHEGTEIVQDVRKEIDVTRKQLCKVDGKKERSKKKELQTEIRMLRREARKREDVVLQQIISSRNVVLATCVGATSRLIKDISFDIVVVDEAAQALEAATWIPLMHCKSGGKVVLAGDHCQLPPTIKSKEAARNGLDVTLFERIMRHPTLHHCARLLDTQYRMHSLISDWASNEMYGGRLMAHASNASHTLGDLESVVNSSQVDDDKIDLEELRNIVMMLVDTAGCDMEEEGGGSGNSQTALSYRNLHEAAIVKKHVQMLYALGLSADQIGVITPYNGQLECLRDLLCNDDHEEIDMKDALGLRNKDLNTSRKLEIRTVDGFQGGEKEAIILSLVRSNSIGQVGFLAEKRRINVAITRAKRHVMVVCDSYTVSNDPFIARLLDHISMQGGEHRSAMEYMNMEPSSFEMDGANDTLSLLVPETVNLKKSVSIAGAEKVSGVDKKQKSNKKNKQKVAVPRASESSSRNDGVAASKGEINFQLNISSFLNFMCPTWSFNGSGSLVGGALGSMALRRFYSVLAPAVEEVCTPRNSEDLLQVFKSLITPHSKAAIDRYKRAIELETGSSTNEVAFEHVIVFPPSLSALERCIIHSVADKLSEDGEKHLYHQSFSVQLSKGQDVVRQLFISRRPFIDQKVPPIDHFDESPFSDNSKSVVISDILDDFDDDEIDQNRSISTPSKQTSDDMKNIDMKNVANDKKIERTITKKKAKTSNKLGGDTSATSSRDVSTIGGRRGKGQGSKVMKALQDDDIDEMALLEMTIAENEKVKDYNKYRIRGQGAMPNYEKNKKVDALHAKIQKAKGDRCAEPNIISSKKKREKVTKKPPRNFGGGRAGDGLT